LEILYGAKTVFTRRGREGEGMGKDGRKRVERKSEGRGEGREGEKREGKCKEGKGIPRSSSARTRWEY